MKLPVVAILALTLLGPGCAARQEKNALKWMRTGEHERAARAWTALAEDGSAEAQFRLAGMYMRGQNVPKDGDEAFRLYREAAEQGLAVAQRQLGNQYIAGRGRPEEDPNAEGWMRDAAENGPAQSQYRLAAAYLQGTAIERNTEQALIWFQRAAEKWARGGARGMVMRMRDDGLLRQTAEAGFAEAQLFLGDLYASGDGVPLSREEAAKWHYLAANQGLAEAQMTLAWAFGRGTGVTRDPVEAARWFRKAAEQGHVNGQYQTGLMLRDGVGVDRSKVEAHMWFNVAAAQGHDLARSTRDDLASKMNRTQKAEAEKLAVAWWLEHADAEE